MDDVDDKVVEEETMEIKETSKVEEKKDGEEIVECNGKVSVAEEKVEVDEEDIVEKTGVEEVPKL
eukprot:6840462-Ditylum_brightwellii.AAC.2